MHLKPLAALLLLTACGHVAAAPPVTRNLELEALEHAAQWPDASVPVLLNLMNQYVSTHQAEEGRRFFCERAQAEPARPALTALCGLFEAQTAGDVPLLQRVAHVERALARLDSVAERDGLSRYLR